MEARIFTYFVLNHSSNNLGISSCLRVFLFCFVRLQTIITIMFLKFSKLLTNHFYVVFIILCEYLAFSFSTCHFFLKDGAFVFHETCKTLNLNKQVILPSKISKAKERFQEDYYFYFNKASDD